MLDASCGFHRLKQARGTTGAPTEAAPPLIGRIMMLVVAIIALIVITSGNGEVSLTRIVEGTSETRRPTFNVSVYRVACTEELEGWRCASPSS